MVDQLDAQKVMTSKSKLPKKANTSIENNIETVYNDYRGDINAERDNEGYFRRLQEASLRMSDKERQEFHSGSKKLDGGLRGFLSDILGKRIRAVRGSNDNGTKLLTQTHNGKKYSFNMVENADAETFHDTMEIARNFLRYGDAVDLHDVDDYKNTTNYISDDGLSGFAITKDGDLISVFSLRKGFLATVGDYIVEKGAITLDCYDSEVQHLPEFYARFLKGFKPVASVDFNYDMLKEYRGKAYADTYVKIYGESPVVLMAKLDNDVEYKHFGKDDWDSAESYRAQMIENDKVDAKTSTDFFDAQKTETYTPATEKKAEQYPNDTGAMESEPMSISANANKSGTFSEQREKAGKTPKNTYTNLDNYLDNNDVSDEAKIILQGKYKDDYIEGKVADKVVQEVNEGYNFTEKQNFLLFFKIYIAFLSDMCYS